MDALASRSRASAIMTASDNLRPGVRQLLPAAYMSWRSSSQSALRLCGAQDCLVVSTECFVQVAVSSNDERLVPSANDGLETLRHARLRAHTQRRECRADQRAIGLDVLSDHSWLRCRFWLLTKLRDDAFLVHSHVRGVHEGDCAHPRRLYASLNLHSLGGSTKSLVENGATAHLNIRRLQPLRPQT